MKKYEIEISPFANEKIKSLADYIVLEWGQTAKSKFLKKLNEVVIKLQYYPKSSILFKEGLNIYKCVVSKRTSLYYRISNQKIEVLNISDNRQNPKMIHEELITLFNK